ncbi:MAG: hypothetical protein KGI75_19125, partial [Rhizobiaceae bacterium]|nr:hypothetical protein [Rhizobiaceae bacterium]
MRVHSSTQSYFSSPVFSQQDTDSDDSASFLLPDNSKNQQTNTPSVTSSGIPSSISSGFWLSQSGQTTPATDPNNASTTNVDGSDSSSDTSSDDLLDEFASLANMTPAQKIRAQYLAEHNLTEDQFEQLPADQQKAI